MRTGIIVAILTVVANCTTMPASAAPAQPDSTGAAADSVGGIIRLAPSQGRRVRAADRFQVSRALELMGSREVEADTAWERRKKPKLAMLLSAVMPGMGQLYNGRRVKVAVASGAFFFYVSSGLLSKKKADRFEVRRDKFSSETRDWRFYNGLHEFWKDEARTFLWWSGAAWLLILIDSWIDAHLYDIRSYTPPPAEGSSPGSSTGYMTLNFKF